MGHKLGCLSLKEYGAERSIPRLCCIAAADATCQQSTTFSGFVRTRTLHKTEEILC